MARDRWLREGSWDDTLPLDPDDEHAPTLRLSARPARGSTSPRDQILSPVRRRGKDARLRGKDARPTGAFTRTRALLIPIGCVLGVCALGVTAVLGLLAFTTGTQPAQAGARPAHLDPLGPHVVLGLTNTTAQAYHGTHALAVSMNSVIGSGQVYSAPPPTAGAGTKVGLVVDLPTRADVSGQLFAQDAAGNWLALGAFTHLMAGGWMALSGVVPSQVIAPLRWVGLSLTNSTPVPSTIFIDHITIGSLTYDFEDGGTDGWMAGALSGASAGLQAITSLTPTAAPATPSATPAHSPPATASTPTGVLTASGTSLILDGKPVQLTGVNAYELATAWGENAGCGPQVDPAAIDALFASLRPDSLVRIWARQGSMAINVHTHQLDWAPLDRVFSAAARYHQLLLVSIGDFGGGCDDGHVKDDAWYTGGYTQVFNPNGLTPYSYADYVRLLVSRYKDSPALGMWEPINEPEAWECTSGYDAAGACTSALVCDEAKGAQSLRYFFDHIGAEIKAIDPQHLVESGVIGSGQCGAAGPDYLYVHESPGIDVGSYHDYSDTTAMPGDQWNGLQVRLQQLASIGKPLIVGEVGIKANSGAPGCLSFQQRADAMRAKMSAQFSAGVAAFLPWDWMPSAGSGCVYETIAPGDPIMSLLAS